MRAYTVRYSDEEASAVEGRARRLAYKKTSVFLRDAGLGHLGRDAGDGLPGWCHDVTLKLNAVLNGPNGERVRLDLLDVARRIEKGLEAIKDLATEPDTK